MARSQPLTALDTSFLSLESALTPMHTGSASTFEGRPFRDPSGRFRLEEVHRLVEERLRFVPRFRQKVVPAPFGAVRPVWVDDPDFDVAHHVRLTAVPSPGTDEQLRRLAAELHMELLDRSRPLWELWFVEGLERGRVGIIQKVHHALMDGVSGVDVATALMDPSRHVQRFGAETWRPDPGPGAARMVAGELPESVTAPLAVARWGSRMLRSPRDGAAHLRRMLGAFGSMLSPGPLAPRSSLNRGIGHRRRLEAVVLPMSEVNRVRAALGGTVNDVILTVVSSGMRRLLTARGEEVSGVDLHALVPVSLRAGPDEHLTLGNRVAGMFVPLPLGEDDDGARLQRVRREVAERKARSQPQAMAAVLRTTDYLPARLASAIAGLVHHQPFVNVVVTNVPGPDFPLYIMGSRMLEAVPIVPLARNLDVSVGILSYNGQVAIGLFADSDLCPDLGVLSEGIRTSLATLGYLADERVGPPRRRAG